MEVNGTKYCKSCVREIEHEATKCPYCQSYQNWYRNPQYWSQIILLPMIAFMFWNTGMFGKPKFADYQDDFSITLEKNLLIQKTKARLITYKIKNNSNYKWRSIEYTVVNKKANEVISAHQGSEYSWLIQPHGESLLSVHVPYIAGADTWQLNIKDLTIDRY